MVFLVFWLASFLYLLAVPVRAGIAWRRGQKVRVGITVGPLRFTAHGSVKYAASSGLIASMTHDRSGRTREISFLQNMADGSALMIRLPAVSRALKYLFRHVKPWRLRALLHISLPEADKTAFLYGAARAFLTGLHTARPDLPMTCSVTADFHTGRTQADLCGILSCRLGHIMAAALIWARDDLSRRIHTWIRDNRSKAS